ncbi:IDEAL domain-containing protein [Viridibacillus sp. FSL E2-0187]|uniref:IDEAL domain-containing protein n=1 Tax=Viridibacillus TaxID=496496 RepID=UPI00187B36E2|nr:IDEAL domain-containing protein [Viridibacillus sp. JNUCC-6]QOV10406.1 IDEAL domain-containing protein [Viridibacillus sp. JNUCC-6]
MLHVRRMEPFYTKKEGNRLKLVFAYQYFSITKEDELYHFVPVEGKEIIINLNNLQIENLSEVFVFQKGSRFIRLPLYQLLTISNIHDHLQLIYDSLELSKEKGKTEQFTSTNKEVVDLITQLEKDNKLRLIDQALAVRDENLFITLTHKL